MVLPVLAPHHRSGVKDKGASLRAESYRRTGSENGMFMLQRHVSIHEIMKGCSVDCAFGKAVGQHVACVYPREGRKDLVVQQLTEMQRMAQE